MISSDNDDAIKMMAASKTALPSPEEDNTMNASLSNCCSDDNCELKGAFTPADDKHPSSSKRYDSSGDAIGLMDAAVTKEQVSAAAAAANMSRDEVAVGAFCSKHDSSSETSSIQRVVVTKADLKGDIHNSLLVGVQPMPQALPREPQLPGAYAVRTTRASTSGSFQQNYLRRSNANNASAPRPGATATRSRSNSPAGGEEDNQQNVARSETADENKSESNLGLVEATPLADNSDIEQGRQIAQDITHQSSDNSSNNNANGAFRFWGSIALALVVLLGAAALVGYMVGQNNSETQPVVIVTTTEGGGGPIVTTTSETPQTNTVTDASEAATNVLSILLDPHLFPSTLDRLEDPTSPQYQAYQWLQKDPSLTTFTTARVIQRFAAATIYYATNGDQWKERGGGPDPVQVPYGLPGPDGFFVNVSGTAWLDYHSHECMWFAFPVFEGLAREGPGQTLCPDFDPATTSTSGGSFVNLNLFHNKLNGTLPPELGLLTTLEQVHLYRNPQLNGEIPTEVGLLTNLHYWSCRACNLRGPIPSQLGLLTKLTYLNTFRNQHTGALPEEVWRLPNLQLLRIGQNEIAGTIPDNVVALTIGEEDGAQPPLLPNIQLIRLSRNQMSGTIPPSLGDCSHLSELDLAANSFTGAIPSELGVLPLTELEVGDNQLSGQVPTELAQLTELLSLNFKNNPDLTGSIEDFLPFAGNSNTTLISLAIQGTQITGTIPPEVCNIESLTFDCSSSLCGCSCPCMAL